MVQGMRGAALAAAMAVGCAGTAAAEVVLINVFEVPAGREEAAIAAWESARDFLRGEPGYIDTALHRSVTPDARFALVNVAHWESPEAFRAATRRMQEAGAFPAVEGVTTSPALYEVIRRDERGAQ